MNDLIVFPSMRKYVYEEKNVMVDTLSGTDTDGLQ